MRTQSSAGAYGVAGLTISCGGGAGDNGFSFAVISPTYTYKPLSELAKYQSLGAAFSAP